VTRISTLAEAMAIPYLINVSFISDEDEPGYYFATLPDFPWTTCSAGGETREAALEELDRVKETVFEHYLETGRSFPAPSEK